MEKEKVAEVLTHIATLLELKGENPFKTRAYINAARAIELLTEPLDKLVAEERVSDIAGIGEAIEKKICELVTTGKLKFYDDLKASTPPGLVAMLSIPGLGPKKIKALHDELGIESVEQLEAACKENKVAKLKGFGEKTQLNICEGITRSRLYAERHLIDDALLAAEPLLEALRSHPAVTRCSTAGSLRRHRETIGDLDLLASSKKPAEVIEFFTQQPGIIKVLAKGDTKASVLLEGGFQSDLRVVSDAEFPAALLYFTGSKEHNIILRQRANERGLRLNEYGLFRSKEETRDPKLLVSCHGEDEIYSHLDLAPVPPELREGIDEISAAERNELPRLIEWTDLRGALHAHSTWSDGRNRIEDISRFMHGIGLEYWAITDHSKSSVQANGLDAKRLRQQIAEVRTVNQKLADEGIDFHLLTGTEVDILADGKLDFPDDVLAELDVVVASVHQRLAQDEATTTRRIIRAVENPYVHILGHMTGRLLLAREPYPVNIHAMIDACAATGTWIELNATPDRLDMDWHHWPYAKSRGVKCVINADAHRHEHAGYLRIGVGMARKGWLTKADVVNTLPFAKLAKELGKKRQGFSSHR